MQQPQGHLSLKSSLYAIGNSKWISQRLVQNHMDAHYRKLLSAKSAIDTSLPKSAITSVKARDSRRRKTGSYAIPGVASSRPNSVRSSRAPSQAGDLNSQGHEISDELQSIVSARNSTTLNPTLAEELMKGRTIPTPTWSPSSAMSLTSPASLNGSVNRARSSLSQFGLAGSGVINRTGKHRQFAGDHIDRFADKFTESGSFQPRVLKKTAQSWLAASKHYVPPPQSRSNRAATSMTPANENEVAITPTTSDDPSKPVIKEKTVVQPSKKDSPVTPKKAVSISATSATTNVESNRPAEDTPFSNANTAFDKLNDEGCVKFIAEVTQDILDRGVFTNKAIENIINEHYYKNKGKLNERKLQLAMSSLREDFGLNETGRDKDALISAHDQYYSAPVQKLEDRQLLPSSSDHNELKQVVPSKESKSTYDVQAVHQTISSSNGGEDLNKTVDDLIVKISELDAQPKEKQEELRVPTKPVEPNENEHQVAGKTVEHLTSLTEQHENGQIDHITKGNESDHRETESQGKGENQHVEDYEEDFE